MKNTINEQQLPDLVPSATFRWLKKKDGTKVLQQEISDITNNRIFWQDIPVVEEQLNSN